MHDLVQFVWSFGTNLPLTNMMQNQQRLENRNQRVNFHMGSKVLINFSDFMKAEMTALSASDKYIADLDAHPPCLRLD